MVTKKKFNEYFGFLDPEVDTLFDIYTHISQTDPLYTSIPGASDTTAITRNDLRLWYDGYCTASGKQLYNPRSIVCALTDNELSTGYWLLESVMTGRLRNIPA